MCLLLCLPMLCYVFICVLFIQVYSTASSETTTNGNDADPPADGADVYAMANSKVSCNSDWAQGGAPLTICSLTLLRLIHAILRMRSLMHICNLRRRVLQKVTEQVIRIAWHGLLATVVVTSPHRTVLFMGCPKRNNQSSASFSVDLARKMLVLVPAENQTNECMELAQSGLPELNLDTYNL